MTNIQTGAHTSNKVVLVVDDEAHVLTMACTMLAYYGYTWLRAASADEALTMARQHTASIDVLLTDLMMSGINGLDLIARFKGLSPQTACILMTGYSPDGLPSGVLLLSKPFSARELHAVISRALAQAAVDLER